MLDSDVAMLYQYTAKNVNKAVKRNIDRFILLDNNEMYHLGASIKDLGKKYKIDHKNKKISEFFFHIDKRNPL